MVAGADEPGVPGELPSVVLTAAERLYDLACRRRFLRRDTYAGIAITAGRQVTHLGVTWAVGGTWRWLDARGTPRSALPEPPEWFVWCRDTETPRPRRRDGQEDAERVFVLCVEHAPDGAVWAHEPWHGFGGRVPTLARQHEPPPPPPPDAVPGKRLPKPKRQPQVGLKVTAADGDAPRWLTELAAAALTAARRFALSGSGAPARTEAAWGYAVASAADGRLTVVAENTRDGGTWRTGCAVWGIFAAALRKDGQHGREDAECGNVRGQQGYGAAGERDAAAVGVVREPAATP